MEIKASQVKELREMTGVAMMECKKALIEAEGDLEKAVDLLRSNSALKAEKKSSTGLFVQKCEKLTSKLRKQRLMENLDEHENRQVKI